MKGNPYMIDFTILIIKIFHMPTKSINKIKWKMTNIHSLVLYSTSRTTKGWKVEEGK
jgi:hypothetical protein